jgi:hypothetical protein
MESIYIIILSALFCAVAFGLDLYIRRKNKMPKQPETPYADAITRQRKLNRKAKTNKLEYIGKNYANNEHKAMMKARRQGHQLYYYHGEYYPTGLIANGRT